MKRIYLAFTAACGLCSLQAQIKEGTVYYEMKINMHKIIQDEQMRAMMPEFRISKHVLLFSDSISIYKTVPQEEAPDPFDGEANGQRMIFKMGSGGEGDELFRNFAASKSVLLTELGAKTYIVEDSIRVQPWKLCEETQTILGHSCHKATTQQTVKTGAGMRISINGSHPADTLQPANLPKTSQVNVVAWYADDMQSPAGPENNGGLPGIILLLNINNGQTVYSATVIKTEVNQKDIKVPDKGKKITRNEFQKLQQEMMHTINASG